MGESAQTWTRELTPVGYVGYRLDLQGRASASVVIAVLDVVPDWSRLRDDLDRVSRVVLRMRQRVVAPVVPITSARWVTDPDFDLDYHLRRISLPDPGSFRQLLDLAETQHAAPLDPNRPLWEATLVEGLEDREGQTAAIIWKFSNAVPDGVGGMAFERVLRANGDGPNGSPKPPLPSPEDLSSAELTRRELRRLPFTSVRHIVRGTTGAIRFVVDSARAPVATVEQLAHVVSALPRVGGSPPGPSSPLLQRRGLRRRVDVLDIDAADLHRAATSVDCSPYDAYVASVCGGLRRYHEELGVPVDSVPLAISIPVEADERPTVVHWSRVRVPAPVGEIDPVARMRKVREIVLTAQDRTVDDLLGAVAPVVAWLPDQVLATVGDPGAGVDVNIGSLGGHVGPAHVAGARVTSVIPVGPLFGAAVTILSYAEDGRSHIGVHLDTEAVADPPLFLSCLQQGFDEVIGVASRPSDRGSR